MNISSPVCRCLLIVCLSTCPVILHGEESIEALRAKAEQDMAEAQCRLGYAYYEGKNIEKNDVEAAHWWRKAADQGIALAQCCLGYSYANGIGLEKNTVESVNWTRKAADQGLAEAQYNLGLKYLSGEGVKKDEAEAVKWYLKAADQGFAKAEFALGDCYAKGRGIGVDEVEAVKWIRRAADKKSAEAQMDIGDRYAEGKGVGKDEAEGLKWIRKAADQGLVRAQLNLARRYEEGKGTRQDLKEAYRWYRKTSEKNHFESIVKILTNFKNNVDSKELIKLHHILANDKSIAYFFPSRVHWRNYSQGYLGAAYLYGINVKKNPQEAIKWLTLAANNGSPQAQNNLGVAYMEGIGVEKNLKFAVELFRKAAEQGIAESKNSLGYFYSEGKGVVKNDVEAYKWFLMASAEGDENANKNIKLIESRITPTQRAEGQRLAQEWEERRVNREADQGAERRPEAVAAKDEPKATGTGFLIARNGYLVTNHHVVEGCSKVRVQTSSGLLDAVVVRMDDTTDLALLKVAGNFEALPVVSSRSARLGATVATVGFPNVGLQGFEPKLSKGDISSLAGIQDDVRYFQISVPVQPGNSGGALVDELGNVVGVVSAQLSQKAALESTGTLAQSVNYAVKSSYLLSFLEAIPEASAEMPDAKTDEQKFETVVDDVKKATVLIIRY